MYQIRLQRALALVVLALAGFAAHADANNKKWVGTWATGPVNDGVTNAAFLGRTLRQVVNASAGGHKVRVRLSNLYGTSPLRIEATRIALQSAGPDIVSGTDRTVTFGGAAEVTIQPGVSVWSDPANLRVPAHAMVSVSARVAATNDPTSPVTSNPWGLQETYLGTNGALGDGFVWDGSDVLETVHWLTGLDVYAHRNARVLVFLGDSLTDGFDNGPFLIAPRTPKNPFPYELGLRLAAAPGAHGNRQWGLLNVGISGNQVTRSDLSPGAQVRFDRDVLGQTGATHVLIWEGPNDLGVPLAFGLLPEISAKEIIDGLQQLALRARAAGLIVIGGTITPFNGFPFPGYWTPQAEAKRLEINAWIRSTDAFDAFVDFDAAVSDGGDPAAIRAEFSSDNLHFNEAGYKALADAIPLELLTTSRTIKKNK